MPDATRTAETTRKYAKACAEVGKGLDVAVLDLWSIMMAEAGWKEGESLAGSKDAPNSPELKKMLSDGRLVESLRGRLYVADIFEGLHFLPPAYKILYESLRKLIGNKWPDFMPGNTSFQLPVWSEAPRS